MPPLEELTAEVCLEVFAEIVEIALEKDDFNTLYSSDPDHEQSGNVEFDRGIFIGQCWHTHL